ncbi:MAG: ThuA domain-containing protein, partial [Phycisphaerae bacterium]
MAARSTGRAKAPGAATRAEDAKRVLLLIGGKYHSWQGCASIIKDLLERSGRYAVTVTEDRSVLAGGLDEYDALALYCQGGEMSDEQEKHVLEFVRGGGALVGLHSANTAFVNSETFVKLLGSAFDHHPAEHQDVLVKLNDAEHPIAVRVGDFLIHDELYVLKNVADDINVLAETRYQGKPLPVAYTRSEGDGRVFYCSLGHSEKQFRHEQFRKLLLHGVDWACGIEPAKKDIGCGLLGYGGAFNMGRTHGSCINDTPGLKTVAACDLDTRRLKVAEEELPGIKTYSSLEKMLADDAVELVVIILPHDQHAEAALKCLRAGKHVVLEKPFCVTLAEADEMVAAAEEAGVMLTCYHNRRWDGDYMTIRRLIQEGAIGEVFELSCGMAGYKRPGDWWRSDKAISGGNFYDWGAHFVDWVLGLFSDNVEWVQG